MRAFPVDLFTIGADLERVEIPFRFGFQAVQNVLFGDGLKQTIAAQTAGCCLNIFEEIIAVENGR